jgi:hypothetical protein
MESDPTGRSAKDLGAKLDDGKARVTKGLLLSFPRACQAVAQVTERGAKKYMWNSWQHVPEGVERYEDAMGRHIVARSIEGEHDRDGFLHRAQVAWNALASLELWLRGQEDDSRGESQGAGKALAEKP